jgi:hypothetical protein
VTDKPRRVPIGFVLLVVVLGAVMFVVPSAFAASRGAPWWLCMTAGALAFPVLPVGWHLFSERRRRARRAAAKTPSTTVLTGGDRFVIRCLAVGIVAVGPAFVLDGKGAFSTVANNVGWIIPPTPWPGHSDAALLSRVPADAEIVVSIHKDAEAKHGDVDAKPAVDAIVAYGNHKGMVYSPGDPDGDKDVTESEINEQLDKLPIKIDRVSIYSKKSPTYVASESWRGALDTATGPSADLKALLAKAPSNALAVIAVMPKTTPELKPIKTAVGWLVMTDDSIKVEGQIEAVDAASATLVIAGTRAAYQAQRDKAPEKCREPLDKINDKLHLDQTGATINVSFEIPMSMLGDVMLCGWKK